MESRTGVVGVFRVGFLGPEDGKPRVLGGGGRAPSNRDIAYTCEPGLRGSRLGRNDLRGVRVRGTTPPRRVSPSPLESGHRWDVRSLVRPGVLRGSGIRRSGLSSNAGPLLHAKRRWTGSHVTFAPSGGPVSVLNRSSFGLGLYFGGPTGFSLGTPDRRVEGPLP